MNQETSSLIKIGLKFVTNHEERTKLSSVIYGMTSFLEKALDQENINNLNSNISFTLNRDMVNYEKLYAADKRAGIGFDLDVNINYDYQNLKDEASFINSDSLFSYKFGIRSTDTKKVQMKRYRCTCGKTEEAVSGVRCPYCKTETQNIYCVRGWFSLNKFKVLSPDFLNLMLHHLRGDIKDVNGVKLTKDEIQKSLFKFVSKKHRSLPNILELQDKAKLIDFIKEYVQKEYIEYFLTHIDVALSSKIPVISKDFRYYSVVNRIGKNNSSIDTHPSNKLYISINNKVRLLNRLSGFESEATILSALSEITKKMLELFNENIKALGVGKDSMIRGKVGGRRKGWSGRLVVEAIGHPRVDVCTIPYAFFGEFTIDYHKDIYIKYGMTPESESRMKNNIPNTNDKVIMVKVLKELKEQKLNTLFAYRAPCIYIGSLLTFEIIGLTHSNVFRLSDIALDAGWKGD